MAPEGFMHASGSQRTENGSQRASCRLVAPGELHARWWLSECWRYLGSQKRRPPLGSITSTDPVQYMKVVDIQVRREAGFPTPPAQQNPKQYAAVETR